ncbi:MAG TPA: hypothetical protein VFO89_15300 [Thermoanaerobaculia bacterium]|nr:hypothetical protein [Thermoanaerobaculia bacterium]
MSAKARITADFATQGDVASRLRIPPARAAELRRRVIDLHVRKPDGTTILEIADRYPGKAVKAGSKKRK